MDERGRMMNEDRTMTVDEILSDYTHATNWVKGLEACGTGPLTLELMKRSLERREIENRAVRLERILAIDRGDESQAPDGWWFEKKHGCWCYDRYVVMHRVDNESQADGLSGWEIRLIQHGPCKFFAHALDAMEYALERV